jgi:CRISPR-associated endonuclease/helicase Cas3
MLSRCKKGQNVVDADFENAFERLTGNRPFPWQLKLFHKMRLGPESFPARCDIPTGLGKTSVIAVWLLAREVNPALPRRLVYVVNRRTVVDQTTFEVEQYKKRLKERGRDLAVSTLRGQFADNRDWSADPSREAVICGTVDMIGSRLLFGGYGIGFKGKPLHAGFLGQDTLIVHDEAHLEPAFQDLLLAIENEQRHGRFPERHPLRVMDLSATSRGNGEVFQLTDEEKHADFDRIDVSPELREVWKRTHAKKTVVLHPVHEEKKELAGQLVKLTREHEGTARAILVFVRTVDDLGRVVDSLPKGRTQQLTGTMRGYERERLLTDDPVFARFLPESSRPKDVTPADGAVYLVCTSAGEVGVNLSADHLVCDLTTFESMAQRFGRVNRFGLRDDTRIDVVYPDTFDEKDRLSPARKKTLDLLRQLDGNANPDALGKLDAKARAAAFAPLPTILPTSDILFDAWSMTSIRDKMPGRPPLEPYLHGIRDYEPAETHVAWREEVGVIVGDLLEEYPPDEMLEAYPIKPHEMLRDRTDRVWKELVKLAKRHPGRPAWVVDEQGKVDVVADISDLASWDKKQADARLGSTTVLLPYDIGGLTTQGTLNGDFPPLRKNDESPEPNNNDVADECSDDKGPLRKRVPVSPENADSAITPKEMKPVYRIVFTDPSDEDGEPTEEWIWFERTTQADADARSRFSYGLDLHLADAKEAAARFVSGLSLRPDLRDAVILAASCHDLGKDRPRWQRGIGNDNYPQSKWAKSGKRGRIERSPYRHEFGSTLDIQDLPAFQALSHDSRELVLHLIAAHHGRARPHFTPEECLDDKHPGQTARQQSIDALNRFARLQRRFGRWGLAYLESLVRAADYAASELANSHPADGAQ